MRSINQELNRIKNFIEAKIKEYNFLMPIEPDEDAEVLVDGPSELVNPKVVLGNLPHNNFSIYGDAKFAQAPYFLVGYDTANFRISDESLSVLIQSCAYTVGSYEITEDGILFPDNMGIIDSTTMLEMLLEWMVKDAPFQFDKNNITIGSYATQGYTYPYSYSYMTFNIETSEGISIPNSIKF